MPVIFLAEKVTYSHSFSWQLMAPATHPLYMRRLWKMTSDDMSSLQSGEDYQIHLRTLVFIQKRLRMVYEYMHVRYLAKKVTRQYYPSCRIMALVVPPLYMRMPQKMTSDDMSSLQSGEDYQIHLRADMSYEDYLEQYVLIVRVRRGKKRCSEDDLEGQELNLMRGLRCLGLNTSTFLRME